MKRFANLVAGVVLASALGGCDSSVPEGMPKEGPMDPQPADFKEFMKKNAEKMNPKGKPKDAAPAPAAKAAP